LASELRPAYCLLTAPLAIVAAIAAIIHLETVRPTDLARAAIVVAWAVGGALLGIRRRSDRLGPIALGGAGLGALAMLTDAWDQPTVARVLLGLLPAVGLHLLVTLPDGRIVSTAREVWIIVAYALGAFSGLVAPHDGADPEEWVFVLLWAAAVCIGLPASNGRYRAADSVDRRRMQWVAWAIAVVAELALVVVALRLLVGWPPHAPTVVLCSTVLIPAALAAGTNGRMIARVDRLLTQTVALAGLTALVIAAYVAVVVARGHELRGSERSLLLLSMVAALMASLAFLPLRAKLANAANQLVYGEHVAPDDALRTWGSRLTRAIPLDELLLQLCESLRKSMSLVSAEIYTGDAGRYELAAGVPHRDAEPVLLGVKERQVVARAGVSGGTWLDIWIPELAPENSARTRVAPIVHGGALLGLVVLTRDGASGPTPDEDDRVLTELARQVALALHNMQLDSALQASMNELQHTNLELEQSRLRIVSAGDAERRRLERNLHDGAQQHLVAMAVKLRLVEELVDDDPSEATKVIEELRGNLKDAIAELRALAHGIFPPLLSSGGLREALPAAAGRSALFTTVETDGVGRYTPEIESTVYFCCLEAMQNAGKHAGDDAEIQIRVSASDTLLTFEVSDDGAGFTPGPLGATGHGFVNMNDRVGTVRGHLTVRSAPGAGTTIVGQIPLS
jgi:signal transduction histidine kinase